MNKRAILVICLLLAAALLFCGIRFWLIPAGNVKEDEYEKRQNDALTHDITTISEMKEIYLGDATAVTQLFCALPLRENRITYAIDGEEGSLTVAYEAEVQTLGEDAIRRDLVYESAAAMACIAALRRVEYRFDDAVYVFTREEVEAVFGAPLSNLLEEERWKPQVQDRLRDTAFVNSFFDS